MEGKSDPRTWFTKSCYESMLPCARERFRRCTVLRANRKSASQCASRRQKSGEWPNNGRKFVSTDQFSTWCRPRLRGKTWPTTPRKRAYTGLITLWVRKQVELVGAAGGTIVNIVRTVSTLTPKGENGHPPFVAKQILIALDSLFERVWARDVWFLRFLRGTLPCLFA